MKKSLLFLTFLLTLFSLNALAVVKTAVLGTVNWNAAASWSPSGVPATGDDVVIPNGSTVNLDMNTQVLTVTVQAGGVLRSGTANNVLTVTSNISILGTLDFQFGGTTEGDITLSGGNAQNFTGTGTVIVGDFSVSKSGGAVNFGDATNESNSFSFKTITYNHTNSTSRIIAYTNSDPARYIATNYIKVIGNITVTGDVTHLRGTVVYGPADNKTYNHVVNGNYTLGGANSTITVAIAFFGTDISSVANTQMFIHDAANSAVKLNIKGDLITPSITHTNAGVNITIASPISRSGPYLSVPNQYQADLDVEGDMLLNAPTGIVGNGLLGQPTFWPRNATSGTGTWPATSTITPGQGHAQGNKMRILVGTAETSKGVFSHKVSINRSSSTILGTIAIRGGFQGRQRDNSSSPGDISIVLRGGTAGSPINYAANTDAYEWEALGSNANNAACFYEVNGHYKIENGWRMHVRGGYRLTVNGRLHVERAASFYALESTSATSYAQLYCGPSGQIICTHPAGLMRFQRYQDDGTSGMPAFCSRNTTTNTGSWRTNTGASTSVNVLYRNNGASDMVISAQSYNEVLLEKNSTGNFAFEDNFGQPHNIRNLTVPSGVTLNMNPNLLSQMTALTGGTLTVEPGAVMNTNGLSVANFTNYSDGTTPGQIGGTVHYNGTFGNANMWNTNHDVITVDKGSFDLNLTGTTEVRGTMTLTSGALALANNTFNLSGSVVNSGGVVKGNATSNFNIVGSLGGFNFPPVNPSLGGLTINRTNATAMSPVVISSAAVLTGNLQLLNGHFSGFDNVTINGAPATITKGAGVIDAAPTFASATNLSYITGSANVAGFEAPPTSPGIQNLVVNNGVGATLPATSNLILGTFTQTDGSLTALGDLTFSQTTPALTITNGDVTVNGNAVFNVGVTVNNNRTLTVGGNHNGTTLVLNPGTLNVTGNTTLTGVLTATNGPVTIGGNLTAGGNTAFNTPAAAGPANIGGNAIITGSFTSTNGNPISVGGFLRTAGTGNVSVAGGTTATLTVLGTDSSHVNGTLGNAGAGRMRFSGTLRVTGAITATGDSLFIGGNAILNGTTTLGTALIPSGLTVFGNATTSGITGTNGRIRVLGNLTASAAVSNATPLAAGGIFVGGNAIVSGGGMATTVGNPISIGGFLRTSGTGNVTVAGGTSATLTVAGTDSSHIQGALGNAGAGRMFFGGTLRVTSTITATGDSLFIGGNAILGGTTTLGTAVIPSGLTVFGNANTAAITGTNGRIRILGNLSTTGAVTNATPLGAGGIIVEGNFSSTAGGFTTTNGNQVLVGGNLTVVGNSSVTGSTSTATLTVNGVGPHSITGTFSNAAGGHVYFNGPTTITGAVTATTGGSLNTEGIHVKGDFTSGLVTLGAAAAQRRLRVEGHMNGALTSTWGEVIIDSSHTATGTITLTRGPYSVGKNVTPSVGFLMGTGNGGDVTIPGDLIAGGAITFTNNGPKVVTIGGKLKSGGLFTHTSGGAHTIADSVIVGGYTHTAGNITYNKGLIINGAFSGANVANTITVNGPTICSGNFTIALRLNAGGDVSIGGALSLTSSANARLNIGTNKLITSGNLTHGANARIEFNNTSGEWIINSTGTAYSGIVAITPNKIRSKRGLTFSGSANVIADSLILEEPVALGVSAVILNAGSLHAPTGSTMLVNTATQLILTKTDPALVSDIPAPTTVTTLARLQTAHNARLLGNVQTNIIDIGNNTLNLNGNEFYFVPTANTNFFVGATGKIINGPLRRGVTNSATYRFPSGNGTKASEVTIGIGAAALTGTMSQLTVNYVDQDPGRHPSIRSLAPTEEGGTTYYGPVAGTGYWELTPNIGSCNNYSIAIKPGASVTSGFKYTIIRSQAPYTSWTVTGTVDLAGADSENFLPDGTLRRTGLNGFSNFAIAGSEETLPVNLGGFTAVLKGEDALVKWFSLTEKNVSHFNVERSFDGKEFESIGQVAANGNTSRRQDYQFNDINITKQTASVVYYRLRTIDFDKSEELSQVVSLNLSDLTRNVEIYPIPANERVFLNANFAGTLTYRLFNMEGKEVSFNRFEGTTSIELGDLAKGIYQVVIEGDTYRQVKKLVVK